MTTDSTGRVVKLVLMERDSHGQEGFGLTGPIPAELGQLANLRVLDLEVNQLTGWIPPELGDLANLRVLNLPGNELSGPIPPELGNLTNLEWLGLS